MEGRPSLGGCCSFLSPLRSRFGSHILPTAYAVGFILAGLPGWFASPFFGPLCQAAVPSGYYTNLTNACASCREGFMR